MTANGALRGELFKLAVVNQSAVQQPLRALAEHRPALALGERLLQELEVAEGFHGVDAKRRKLIAAKGMIEARLQMVHARIKKAFAVQTNPQTNRAKLRRGCQR